VADVEDLPGEITAGGGDRPAELTAAPLATPRLEAAPPQKSQLAVARRSAERDQIVRTLEQCAQNRSRAAESLGISRTAFYKKLRQLGLAGGES
jgi:DNA-binding NtrC family response regulator